MPLVLHPRGGRKHLVAVAVAVTALSGLVCVAPAMADPPSCSGSDPTTWSQPFTSFGDNNWYAAPAGTMGDSGWTLTGGASQIAVTNPDGSTSNGIDLPSGSMAVSPSMCVNASFPTARTMVRNVVGGEGVQFYVSYAGTQTWNNPQNTGQVHGQQNNWSLSDPVNLNNNNQGWQVVRFTFIPGGHSSDFQLYNFWVDPHRSG